MRALATSADPEYSSRIIKAGALLGDSRVFLREWDGRLSAKENLARFRESNVFGKRSRSRAEDVLAELRRRYPLDDAAGRDLRRFVRDVGDPKAVDRVLAYHAAKSDPLLYDFIAIHLGRLNGRGERHVTTGDTIAFLHEAERRSRTTRSWSQATLRALAKGLHAATRDFGLLSGKTKKVLAIPTLPLEAFLYVVYRLKRQASGIALLTHRDWKLFLLSSSQVEALTASAAQRGLLSYESLGQMVSIGFPYSDLDKLLDVIAS